MITRVESTITQSFTSLGDRVIFNEIVTNDLGVELTFDEANLGLWVYRLPTDGIRIPITGLYHLSAGISFAAQTQVGRSRTLFLYRTTVDQMVLEAMAANQHNPIDNNNPHVLNVTQSILLNAGEVIYTAVTNVGGTNTSATAATTGCFNAYLSAALIIK